MVDTPINVTQFLQIGRSNKSPKELEPVYYSAMLDFTSANSYVIDFNTISQSRLFGIPKTLFIDNGTNPKPVEIVVSLTQQTFTVPPYAQGRFALDAAVTSAITFTSDGGATSKNSITIYNYEIAPQIWYSYGATNNVGAIPVFGTMSEGDTIATADDNRPVYVGGKASDGTFRAFTFDAAGSIPVSEADGANVALGAVANAAYTGSGNGTVISVLKGLWTSFFGVASASADSGNPVKVGAIYNLTAPVFADGNRSDIQSDVNGRLLVNAYGNVASGATDSGNPIKIGGRFNTTTPTLTNGQRGDIQLNARGSLNVQLMDASTNPVGIAQPSANGIATTIYAISTRTFNYNFNGTTFDRVSKPNTNNRLLSAAASVNNTLVKAGATDCFQIRGRNAAAAARYLKLYNKATIPAAGTDTPTHTFFLPASSDFEIVFNTPYYFALGLGFALTVNAADADATALTAGDIVCQNISYQ